MTHDILQIPENLLILKPVLMHCYLCKMIFYNYVARGVISGTITLTCNENQDNDFDKFWFCRIFIDVIPVFLFP